MIVSQMLNWDIPHSACKDIWDYLLRLVGLSVSTSWKGKMGARWKTQTSKTQVLDSGPKISPAASTKQYADPGVQAGPETKAWQFKCCTSPNPIARFSSQIKDYSHPTAYVLYVTPYNVNSFKIFLLLYFIIEFFANYNRRSWSFMHSWKLGPVPAFMYHRQSCD